MCYKNIEYLVFRCIWVTEETIEKRRKVLESRFKLTKTVQDTRKYHYFIPIDDSRLKEKFTSLDDYYNVVKKK